MCIYFCLLVKTKLGLCTSEVEMALACFSINNDWIFDTVRLQWLKWDWSPRLIYLNASSPVGRTIWEALGGMALLEDFEVLKTQAIHS